MPSLPSSPIQPSPPVAAPPRSAVRVAPAPPRVDVLPPWKVLLHNDDVTPMDDVVETIVMLGVANRRVAIQRMLEAHTSGVALLLVTHRERAELVQEQFASRKLKATVEPA